MATGIVCLVAALAAPTAAQAASQAAEPKSPNTVANLAVAHYAKGLDSEPTARAAGICGKSLFSTGRVQQSVMSKRLHTVLDRLEDVDVASDAAVVLITVISGGTITAPAVVGKLISKLGTHGIKKVVKRLIRQVDDVAKKKKVGVRVKVKCKFKVIPYPSIGTYT